MVSQGSGVGVNRARVRDFAKFAIYREIPRNRSISENDRKVLKSILYREITTKFNSFTAKSVNIRKIPKKSTFIAKLSRNSTFPAKLPRNSTFLPRNFYREIFTAKSPRNLPFIISRNREIWGNLPRFTPSSHILRFKYRSNHKKGYA